MKILDKETGEYKELRIKPGGDTLPIGTIVKYDGKMVDIFDKNNINNLYGYIYGTSNIYVSSTTGADKMLYVPIESSKNYIVSKVASAKFRIATNPTVPTVGDSTVTSKVANDKATELSITSGSTDKYLILYYYNSSNDTLTEQEILNSIKIKKQDYTIPEGYEEVPKVEVPKGARMQGSTMTIENSTGTNLIFANINYDFGGFCSSDKTKFIIPTGVKRVRLICNMYWGVEKSSGYFYITINRFNSSNTQLDTVGTPANTMYAIGAQSYHTSQNMISSIIDVNEGDYFVLRAYHNTGSSITLQDYPLLWFEIEVIE